MEMKLHETIIKTLQSIYLNQKGASSAVHNIDQKLAVVQGLSPDLMVKMGFMLYFKVETESTVTTGSAIEWKSFSEKLGTFYLVVPEPLKTEAIRIIKQLSIPKIVVVPYRIKENKLVFGSLP